MGADVGDVGEPRLVGAIGAEVAPHRVVMEVLLRGALLAGGAPGAGARDAPPTVLAHDAGARFWEVDTPAVFGLMNVFGAPYMPMLASYSPPIILASSKSRNACLLAGLPAHR